MPTGHHLIGQDLVALAVPVGGKDRVEGGYDRLFVTGDPPGAEMVDQKPDDDSSLRGAHEGVEQASGLLVPGGDLELHVHELLGALDLEGHRLDRLKVVGEQLGRIAAECRECPKVPVQRGYRLHLPGHRTPGLERGEVRGALVDPGIDLCLFGVPSPAQLVVAQQ